MEFLRKNFTSDRLTTRAQGTVPKLGGWTNIGMIVLLAAIIITTGIFGTQAVKGCEKDGYDGENEKDREDSKKIVLRNQKILATSIGIGCGLITFIMLSMVTNKLTLIIMGIILSTIAIIAIKSYEKLGDDYEGEDKTKGCPDKKKIQNTYSMMYGLLGVGIGLSTFSICSGGLGFIQSSTDKARVLGLIVSLFAMLITSTSINTANQCDDGLANAYNTEGDLIDTPSGKKVSAKSAKNVSIGLLVVNILLMIGVGASFYFVPPGSAP